VNVHGLICLCGLALQTPAVAWSRAPSLPIALSNNSVVALSLSTGPAVFSFLGIDSTKRWHGITNRAFRWQPNTASDAWEEIQPVPGPGRLASTVQAVGGRIYVLGGYTVARDGTERSRPDVAIYDLVAETWSAGASIPVPVDDAVSGVWRDSLIFLISGWHDTDNVRNVQIYDPTANLWRQATPIPGTPVFGHAGAIAGNSIVYVDGARRTGGQPRYTLTAQSWHGAISPNDPTTITWTRLPNHPGPPVYRAGALGVNGWVVVAGGTDNPYNYDGIGYDGVPAQPLSQVFAYQVETGSWHIWPELPSPSMDHRTLGWDGADLYLVGGMGEGQDVLRNVLVGRVRW
jgi:N-acetylneuraminic acid mutarotase